MLIPTIVLLLLAPAPTADEDLPHGTLTFQVVDREGRLMPARFTFLDADNNRNDLFPNPNAAPKKLAVRKHAVYTLDGEGTISVPVGSWDVMASHGIEWSIDETHIEVEEGGKYTWTASLIHEIDTTNWVSGDFHLHTLTHSGHGDSNMNERIISIVGEGVEFAVATDHDHNTDYQPIIDSVGANEHLTAVVGNEVSSPYGHLNTFPLDPDAKVVNEDLEAVTLFPLIRQEQNPYGVVPIIQINHPRWGNIDYFGSRGLDPITGESDDDRWSWDFDTVEVLNENYGWGFHDAEITEVPTRSSRHSVLRDWFNMLNAGRDVSAVGNSDSHTVIKNIAGIPRNFVYVGYDDAGNIKPRDVTDGIRSGRLSTTTGPFMRMTVNGRPMGSTLSITDEIADIHVDAQAASWIDLDTITVIQNGDEVAQVTIENSGEGVTHLRPRIRIDIPRDCWVIAIAEGDEPMTPYVNDKDRPVFPVAIGNPVFIDADGDGVYTPPLEWAKNIIATDDLDDIVQTYLDVNPTEQSLLVMASTSDYDIAKKMVLLGLTNESRIVRLAATKTAFAIQDSSLIPMLSNVIDNPDSDRYLAFSAWMAIDETDGDIGKDRLLTYADQFGWDNANRYTKERKLNLPGDFVRDWQVAAYFAIANDNDRLSNLEHQKQIPEPNILSLVVPKTTTGNPLAWVEMQTDKEGYLNLSQGEATENTIAYARCWLWSPDDRTVEFTIGSDDGCRMWVNGELVYHDASWHWATKDASFGSFQLQKGWNPVLFKILNGLKGMGMYFRVLDVDVVSTNIEPPK